MNLFRKRATVALAAALALSAGVGGGAAPAKAEEAQPLPDIERPTAGSGGSLMLNPKNCKKLKAQSDEIAGQWQQAVTDGDYYTANQLRVDYTNVTVSWAQCLQSANRLLLSS
ncbi:hypothetical protein FYJ88_06870 [Corynebacterium urealyticum]|uniref:hypothetical protein n=1 Tax=Corynebacterium urealyticum TaxID=43771 RepID=UPI0011E7C7BD|nr:hypothetical protein [Corynebacterium urealyticum]TYR18502.1 hypothetical protein FYJ88_06870 [Corynebacterium urealyticum]